MTRGGGNVMELRTASPRKYVQSRLLNLCAQCGDTIFLPEWSEYLDRQRVRHLWECEACGYKVTLPSRGAATNYGAGNNASILPISR